MDNWLQWQPVIIAVIGILAALATALVASRDLRLRQRLESTKSFLALAAVAQARRSAERTDPIGASEQTAALYLLAEFGKEYKHLREPARAALKDVVSWSRPQAPATGASTTTTGTSIFGSATAALARLPKP